MLVTVFTPVYNRAGLIKKLKNSLDNQTVKNFEWLIIDDGSTDDIREVVGEFQSCQTEYEIVFKSKQNGGKHTCINIATDLARGELFFIVDSDDYLTCDAIEKVIKMYASIEDKSQFCGVAGVRVRENGELIGASFEEKYVDATALERTKYNIVGDKAEIFITDILKRYKFPEFEGEKFLTENVVWLKMADDGYKIRWFNEPLYICEYLEDGLTDLVKRDVLKNFYGDTYTNALYIRYYRYSLPMRIRIYGGAYDRYLKDKKRSKDKKSNNEKLIFILRTFEIGKLKLKFSYCIYKMYKFFKGNKS